MNNLFIRYATLMSGVLIFSLGINLFLTPLHLYNGGLLGICQLLRTLLTHFFDIPSGIDISGLIYYLVNIPLFFLAFKSLGRKFFLRTIVCVTLSTLALSFVPIQSNPILGDDILASCIFAGIMGGIGCGLILLAGGSLGGTDIIGLYLVKKRANASIGKITILINIAIYIICLIAFTPSIALYSIIYSVISSLVIDRVHTQNINVQVMIISRNNTKALEKALLENLYRGVTIWKSEGGYTHKDSNVLCSVMSKYELPLMHQLIQEYDPEAFVIENEGARVYGNYLKKLS